MKFLKWYSALMVTWSIVAMAIEMVGETDAYNVQVNLWGIAMFIPVAIYLWIVCIKKGAGS